MAKVLSSISGNLISAASAGFAPTNSGDVSAIASAYQVVSATATQLYAGTAYLTSVNGAPISASRAGNAANASMATSAYYDGTGRLISALPDSATVSAIASSYAESAVSGKADSSSLSSYALSSDVSGVIDTVSTNSASWGGVDSATVSAIASSYAESAASSKLDTTAQVVSSTAGDGVYITSINGMGLSGQGGGGAAFPAEINYGGNVRAVVTTGFQDNTATRPTLFISSNPAYNSYPRMMLSENHVGTGKSGAFLADAFEFYTGTGIKVFRVDPTGVSATKFFLGSGQVYGTNWALKSASVSGGSGTATWQYGTAEYNQLTSVHDTVSANSATWGQGGVDSATVSAIASAYGHSALSSIYAGPGVSYGGADDPMIGINYDGAGPLGTDDNNVLICKTDGTTIGVNAAGELVSLVGGGVDSATVSAIASSYAESAASSKLDTSAQVVTSTASAYDMDSYAWTTEINGLEISAAKAYSASYANTAETAYSADFASSSDYATYDTNGRFVSSLTDSATVSAIASAYQVVSSVGDDGTYITSINGSALSGAGGGGATGDYVEKSATEVTIGSNNTASATAFAQGVYNSASGYSFAQGSGNTASSYSIAQGYANNARDCSVAFGARASAVGTAFAIGKNNLHGNGYITGHSAAFVIGDGTANTARHDLMLVTKDGEITMYSSTADTVGLGLVSSIKAISAAATGGGGGVVTATGSASATSGFWPVTTSYLVSSINGSALLPYGYSSLSANSAKWTSTNSAVSANSANWNSAYSLISGVTALLDSI